MLLRRVAIPLLLIGASVLVFFGGLEIALRLINYPRTEAKILCLDGIMGNVYCPNLNERLDNLYGSTLQVSTNSMGMADREYPLAKPPGTIRVALLGDSLTASLYLPVEQKFKTLWENALTRSLGHPVEILNFAVDGMGTWEALQMFHLRARPFQPDVVILGFFWGNDTWNNLASRDRGRANPLKDEYEQPSWLMRTRVAHRSSIRWMWNNSAAFQFLDILKTRIQTQRSYERAQEAAAKSESSVTEGTSAGTSAASVSTTSASTSSAPAAVAVSPAPALPATQPKPHYDPGYAWDSEAWRLTRELMLKLKAETQAAGSALLVFQLPMLAQLRTPRPLPHRELEEFLAANGMGNADAFAALSRLSPQQQRALYLGDDVHLTAEGHRVFAEAALPQLELFIRQRVGGKDTAANGGVLKKP